jgi:hypothetical protein
MRDILPPDYFSSDYAGARERFLNGARNCGCEIASYPIGQVDPDGSPLTVDVAISTEGDASRCLLLSSGVHGVEGYFGSAVQLCFLDEWASNPDARPTHRWVMVHALNPYGMAWLRRVNEDNVDLNRNLLRDGADYHGRPEGYDALHHLLNPTRKKLSRWEPLRLKFALAAIRHGRKHMQQAISAGQYDHPQGLFFGGHGPTKSHQILTQHFDSWLGDAQRILHIDFHTGLGRPATYQLLTQHPTNETQWRWLMQTFGAEFIRICGQESVSAELRGSFDDWGPWHAGQRDYVYVGAEFGTYSPLDVITALRQENLCVHSALTSQEELRRVKARLLEVFCPASLSWRRRVLDLGAQVVDQALANL